MNVLVHHKETNFNDNYLSLDLLPESLIFIHIPLRNSPYSVLIAMNFVSKNLFFVKKTIGVLEKEHEGTIILKSRR